MTPDPGLIGIFGVTGFIGTALKNRLAARGHDLRGVSRHISQDFRDTHAGPRVELVEASIQDPFAIAAALQGVDTVVQLISTSAPSLGNRFITSDIMDNVIPHVTAIEAALSSGARRYIFVSSGGAVYGANAPVPTPEDAATFPLSSHGITKLMIEKYLALFGAQDDLDHVVLRPSNPYGPGQTFRKGQGLIPAVLNRVMRDQPVQVFGDGSAERDYIFIDDVVAAIEAAILRPEARQQTFNIGSGTGTSVTGLLDALQAGMGRPIRREYLPARKSDVPRSVLDIARARALLGWAPGIGLAEGIGRTLRAHGLAA